MSFAAPINFANAMVEPWSNNVHIYLAIKEAGKVSVASGIVFTSYEDGQAVITPDSLKLTRPAAQTLIDALWRAGVRPSEQEQTSTQTTALKTHLDDMRKIAFNFLKVKP